MKKKLSGLFGILGAAAAILLSRGASGPKPAPVPPPVVEPARVGYLAVWLADAHGRAVVGARVTASPALALPESNGDGWSGLAAPMGEYRVRVEAAGFVPLDTSITVDGHSDLRVSLARDAVSLVPLTTDGPIFRQGGQPFRWKGVTAFGLLNRYAKGEDIRPFLEDVRGFSVLRIFPYVPANDWRADAWDAPAHETVIAFLREVERAGFYVELVLLTDDNPARLDPARRLVAALVAAQVPNVILEVGNEPQTHKDINTAALKSAVMASGFLVSSGNYEDSRQWYGHWIGFHSARDSEWPRRAHDALDYYQGGGPNFPEEPALKVPAVCDEPIRPDQAGYDVEDFRAYFGTCALLGAGATYHFSSGKFGNRPTPEEARIAAVVLEALNAFPADAPLGPYHRPVEASLRTYQVGPYMARVRPQTATFADPAWVALDAAGILWRRR